MTAVLLQPGMFRQTENMQHVIDLGHRFTHPDGHTSERTYTDACPIDPLEHALLKQFVKELRRACYREGSACWYMVTITYCHPGTDMTWLTIRHGFGWTAERLQRVWDKAMA